MMEFRPILKRKKGWHNKTTIDPPFPECVNDGEKFTGIFTGFSIEVCQPEAIVAIYDSGFYGKGSKSRSAPKVLRKISNQTNECVSAEIKNEEVHENLVLDLEESTFLSFYLNILQIVDLNNKTIEWDELIVKFQKIKPNFIDCFAGYLYLKSKNWVVKSGTKFGGNFLIYKKGLKYYHASFIVFISRTNSSQQTSILAKDIKGIQRIAETSDKDVLFLEITRPQDDELMLNSPIDFKKFTISENIIRRFNYSAFVQT